MVFGSYVFLFAFLPVVVIGWWLIRPPLWRLAWLTLASYFFYCWWDWRYLPLLLIPTVVDHLIQRRLAAGAADGPRPLSRRARRGLLVTSLVVDLGLLGFFKYAGFFMSSLDGIASWFGLSHPLPVPEHPAAAGHLVLHLHDHLGDGRRLPRHRRPGPQPAALRLLHRAVPQAGLRAHHAARASSSRSSRPSAPRDSPGSSPAAVSSSSPAASFKKLLIADQLAPHVNGLFAAHDPPRAGRRLGGRRRLHPAALLRLLRLHRHGHRRRPAARLQAAAELRLAVQVGEHPGLLAPLAHDA